MEISPYNPAYAEDQTTRPPLELPPPATWFASHIVHIDSRNREPTDFANPNTFQLRLRTNLKGVFSVELLNMIIPINQVPNPPYLWLLCPQLENYDNMVASRLDPNTAMNTVATRAFAKIPIEVGAGVTQFFRKSEFRIIKKFKNLRDEMSVFDLQIVDPDGTPYVFANGAQWSATLEFVAKS
jgi:hypothetical protein